MTMGLLSSMCTFAKSGSGYLLSAVRVDLKNARIPLSPRETISSCFLFVSLNYINPFSGFIALMLVELVFYWFTTLWLIFKALAIFLLDSLAAHFSRKISFILSMLSPFIFSLSRLR